MKGLAEQIGDIDGVNIYGRVVGVRGLMVEIAGPVHAMSVGARIVIETGANRFIPAEDAAIDVDAVEVGDLFGEGLHCETLKFSRL